MALAVVAGIDAGLSTNLQLNGSVTVDASGTGGNAVFDGGKSGGAAQGGQAFVQSTGGVIATTGLVSILARRPGRGRRIDGLWAFPAVLASARGTGGAGVGGTASLAAGDGTVLGKGGAITLGSATLSAIGGGGSGNVAEDGAGGIASVTARNGSVTGFGVLRMDASGAGGGGLNGGGGAAGRGGTAQVMAYSALEGESSVTFGTGLLTARGTGGAGRQAKRRGRNRRCGRHRCRRQGFRIG